MLYPLPRSFPFAGPSTPPEVQQLSKTARYIAPAVFVFTKRVENVIVQLEKELRRQDVGCWGREQYLRIIGFQNVFDEKDRFFYDTRSGSFA